MQPIEINVHVQLGVTPELSALLTPLLVHVNNATPAKEVASEQPTVEAKPAKTAKKKPEPEPEPEPAPVVEEVKEEPEPAIEEQEQPKEYTAVDVREAMDRTRTRIEGEGYKDNTTSEGYKQWHRVLTGWFKNTAATLGAEKPSTLPDSNTRYMFIQECDRVEIINGELGVKAPF